MPRPARVTPERLLEAAVHLVDTGGESGLSLTALAARLQVRPPSLYNHVDSLDGVRYLLAVHGLTELVERFRDAAVGRVGRDALQAIAQAYRAFATEHPGLYALTQASYEGRDDTLQRLGRDTIDVVLSVLHSYGLHGEDAIHATRGLRSALAGFVALELNGGFGLPLAVDDSLDRLIDLFDHGFRSHAVSESSG